MFGSAKCDYSNLDCEQSLTLVIPVRLLEGDHFPARVYFVGITNIRDYSQPNSNEISMDASTVESMYCTNQLPQYICIAIC